MSCTEEDFEHCRTIDAISADLIRSKAETAAMRKIVEEIANVKGFTLEGSTFSTKATVTVGSIKRFARQSLDVTTAGQDILAVMIAVRDHKKLCDCPCEHCQRLYAALAVMDRK